MQAPALICANRFHTWSPQQWHCFHTKTSRHAGPNTYLSLSNKKPGLGPGICVQQILQETLTRPKDGEQSFQVWGMNTWKKLLGMAFRAMMNGKIIKWGGTLLLKYTHICIYLFNFSSQRKWGHTKEMMNLCFGEMPLCPLKLGHRLVNSEIVQLWCNVMILLWSSLTTLETLLINCA